MSTANLDADAKRLAELGYKQDLVRSWSGFSNFAISFSIISILAGCFTNFGVAWYSGGPVSISWSWPIVSAFILLIGFTMSELVSAYPTSGGIYWWASKLGGPRAGFYTGWLNLVGLVAVTAGVAYGCATFIDLTLDTWSTSWSDNYSLTRVFIIFVVVLALAAVLNIFSGHLMAIMNNISVWWHVAGAAAIVVILLLVPDTHQDFGYVFAHRISAGGYGHGTSSFFFFFVVIPMGFLLTQYTITGFDACAHLSEETRSAATGAAKGIWQSIFYSAVGGYILLLCVVFAVPNLSNGQPNDALGNAGVQPIFVAAMGSNWAGTVLFISSAGQLFCAVSCMTSASRMLYAFSRDRAVPGSSHWSQLSANRVPARAVMLVGVLAALLTLPALIKVDVGGTPLPIAFFAVTSIAVLGLYLSFAIPIWLRWRHGENFEVGEWNNGSKYKWMNPIAVAEIVIVSLYLMLPNVNSGNPFDDAFSWKSVNYSPIVLAVVLVGITIWWEVSAKTWFKGPIRTIDEPDAEPEAPAPEAPVPAG
ncbi:MAG TPA: amino acid permease [Marmoricola sp.]|nr:amino acid permease [Marmoricola sp.]